MEKIRLSLAEGIDGAPQATLMVVDDIVEVVGAGCSACIMLPLCHSLVLLRPAHQVLHDVCVNNTMRIIILAPVLWQKNLW